MDLHILEELEKNNLKSFKSPFGTIGITSRTSVKTPKTREEKESFFNWLKERDESLYWHYASVNSQSLNSLYKEQYEIAKENGDFDFSIPGVGDPQITKIIYRRAK